MAKSFLRALLTNFNVANMSFNTIRENKVLAKISELQFKVEQTILVVYGRLP